MKIYIVYDNILERPVAAYIADNKASAVRGCLHDVMQKMPLRDVELRECEVILDNYELVPWTTYKFPETKAEALSPLELSEKQIEMLNRAEDTRKQYEKDIDNYNKQIME